MNDALILEIISVLLSLLFLVLVIRENIWCWAFGILSSFISIFLFVEAKLYSEAILYGFYVLIGFYGWYQWSYNKEENTYIKEWRINKHLVAISLGVLGIAGLGTFFKQQTDATVPYMDASSTMFSFIASYMEAHKILSTWIYWILINGFTIGLYLYKGLHIYASLMVIYFVMSFVGWFTWRKRFSIQSGLN